MRFLIWVGVILSLGFAGVDVYGSDNEGELSSRFYKISTIQDLFDLGEAAAALDEQGNSMLTGAAIIWDFDESLAYLGLDQRAQKLLREEYDIDKSPEDIIYFGSFLGVISTDDQEELIRYYFEADSRNEGNKRKILPLSEEQIKKVEALIAEIVQKLKEHPLILFSRECFRVDRKAFDEAGLLTLGDENEEKIPAFRELEGKLRKQGCIEYRLIEQSMPSIFSKLRSMEAFLAVCSGNPYNKDRGDFMLKINFCKEGCKAEELYNGGRTKEKAEMIIELLNAQKRKFSRLLFIDNNANNVTECLASLCQDHAEVLARFGIREVVGVHYDRFHSVYMNPRLLKLQFHALNK